MAKSAMLVHQHLVVKRSRSTFRTASTRQHKSVSTTGLGASPQSPLDVTISTSMACRKKMSTLRRFFFARNHRWWSQHLQRSCRRLNARTWTGCIDVCKWQGWSTKSGCHGRRSCVSTTRRCVVMHRAKSCRTGMLMHPHTGFDKNSNLLSI